MKILYGFYRADAGEVRLDGRPIQVDTPQDARRYRIGMVFQEMVQVPAMTVAENIALFLPGLPAVIDGPAIAARIRQTSKRYGLAVDPAAPVWQLSVGEQQRVEIVKLLLANARILILDEPTRSLAPHEIDGLFEILSNLRRDGYAVVFIAHKLREVLACADRITVMRRGVVAGSMPRAQASEATLVSLMFGAPVAGARRARRGRRDRKRLRSSGWSASACRRSGTARARRYRSRDQATRDRRRRRRRRERPARARRRDPRPRAVPRERSTSAPMRTRWPVATIRANGVASSPKTRGAWPPSATSPYSRTWPWAPRGRTRAGGFAIDWARRALISTARWRASGSRSRRRTGRSGRSGGNVQRVILARELARDPRLIVAFYPRGASTSAARLRARAAPPGARRRGGRSADLGGPRRAIRLEAIGSSCSFGAGSSVSACRRAPAGSQGRSHSKRSAIS